MTEEMRRQYRHKRRKQAQRRAVLVVMTAALSIGVTVGGTLAWLTAKSDTVENVFTTSDIGVNLTEVEKLEEDEDNDVFKMIPGWTINKSPRVTVTANSESCWLFVEVTESTSLKLDDYVKYAVNTNITTIVTDNVTHGGWTQGTGFGEGGDGVPENVYYRMVEKAGSDQVFAVLGSGTYTFNSVDYTWANDEVLTNPEVTKTMMVAVTDNQPKLSFTAYASQLKKNNTEKFSAGQAWKNVKPKNP